MHSVHSSDHKGDYKPEHNKKKGINNRRGGNRKENSNDEKSGGDAVRDKKSKWKLNFLLSFVGETILLTYALLGYLDT